MYRLTIAPKITEYVSQSAKRFIEADTARIVRMPEQKAYEYVGAGSRIQNNLPSPPPLPYSRHPYFSPDANINAADEEVAKHIRILG